MKKLKRLIHRILGRFPSKLPSKGLQDLDDFTTSILTTYDLPDMLSYRNAVATMIMHLGPQESHKPKYYFARSIKKAASNQIAYEKIQQIKKSEQELIDKAKEEHSESKVSEAEG